MLGRLAAWCYDHRRRVVVGWLVAIVAMTVLASVAGGSHRVDYSTPGSESAEAQRLLAERFPEQAGDAVYIVIRAEAGLDDPTVSGDLDEVTGTLTGLDHVVEVRPGPVSADGSTTILTVQMDDTGEKIPAAAVEDVMDTAGGLRSDGVQVDFGGWPVENLEGGSSGSEGIGLAAAALILLVAFGSAVAAGLPILTALAGLGVGLGVVGLLANVIQVADWSTSLASMIGIGVGIDYALFIVTRYRTGLAEGLEPRDAVVRALTTSGRAVLFAGATVVVSLLGLGAVGLEYMWGVALATVAAVLLVLAASLTLLPATLGFAGRAIDRLRIPGIKGGSGDSPMWTRWGHVVQRRPWTTGLIALGILVALTIPVMGMRFGFPDAGTNPESLTSRRAFDVTSEQFGPGANGPLIVAVELPDGDTAAATAAAEQVAAGLAEVPGVAGVSPPVVNAAADTAVITVQPQDGPQEPETEQLIRDLRDDVLPGLAATTDTSIHIGGTTASNIDQSDYMAGKMPWFIGAVLALSFLLLMTVFRSVLVALKAVIMNLLSIGAAYGVVAIAVQGGWLGELIGIHEPTPVPVFVPILMFAALFGLSMDYEVFLLSRIREDYLRTGDNRTAVADGIASTGRVITAAAAIMVTVFLAFVGEDLVFLKVAGLGLATAVLLDATVVRMVLVPATMELLGDRNWWLPAWLDRILPRIDVEGHGHDVDLAATPAADVSPPGSDTPHGADGTDGEHRPGQHEELVPTAR